MWNDRSVARMSFVVVAIAWGVGAWLWQHTIDDPPAVGCTQADDMLAAVHGLRATQADLRGAAADAEHEYGEVVRLSCGDVAYEQERLGRLVLDRGDVVRALAIYQDLLETPDLDPVMAGEARAGFVRAYVTVGRRASAFATFRVLAPAHVAGMLA